MKSLIALTASTTSIRIALAALVTAGAVAPAALAGGEPKNQWPFTWPAAHSTQQAQHVQSSGAVVISGERKNEPPFTRRVSSRTAQTTAQAGYGEPKNQAPFTQPAQIVVRSGSGFDWTSAGLGVAAGVGIALAAAGGLLVARNSRRRPLRTAP